MPEEMVRHIQFDDSIRPHQKSLFRPVYDRRGLRLAIVLGNEALSGICPYAARNNCIIVISGWERDVDSIPQ